MNVHVHMYMHYKQIQQHSPSPVALPSIILTGTLKGKVNSLFAARLTTATLPSTTLYCSATNWTVSTAQERYERGECRDRAGDDMGEGRRWVNYEEGFLPDESFTIVVNNGHIGCIWITNYNLIRCTC